MFDELTLTLVDDETIRQLNATFRRRDRVTDVLSFDLRANRGVASEAPEAGLPPVGEVIVSTGRVVKQARSRRVPPGRELARLVLHGLLHLQGHDHQQAGERRVMRAEEARLLRATRTTVETLVLSTS